MSAQRRSFRRPSPAYEHFAAVRIGRVLRGKWELVRVLGVGGMATVYEARHRNGARVAVKMLHPSLSASASLCDRFVREGYVANLVGHRRIPKVLDDDLDEVDGSAFLVMELIEGMTLEERLQACTTGDREILRVARDVLEILACAHDKGVIHRDIKPDNLIIDGAGKIHVLDFGIARLLENEDVVTTTGAPYGTPGYISPEQALGRRDWIGPATDIYLLGATLFTLASGEFVHGPVHAQELVVAAATRRARSLSTCAPHLAKEVIRLVDRATRHNPSDRFPSARSMLQEVERIESRLVERAAKRTKGSPESKHESKHESKEGSEPKSLALALTSGPIARHKTRGSFSMLAATGAAAIALGVLVIASGVGRMKRATAEEHERPAAASRSSTLKAATGSHSASPNGAVVVDRVDVPGVTEVIVGEPMPPSTQSTLADAAAANPSALTTSVPGARRTQKRHKNKVIDVGY